MQSEFTVYQGLFSWRPRIGRVPVVVANGQPLELFCDTMYGCHSPTGFAWGYVGSGPAQLALALLVHHLGWDRFEMVHRVHPGLYQEFKDSVVATLSQDMGWTLTSTDIDKALTSLLDGYSPHSRSGEGEKLTYPPMGIVLPRDEYTEFIKHPLRHYSVERDFGVRWKLRPSDSGRWRVSLVEKTGELYAVATTSSRSAQGFVHLGVYRPNEVKEYMNGWAQGNMVLTDWFTGIGEVR